ncbi:MAG: methionine synthase [Bacteroidales bacterium]|jgi:5-methyltetrahydrofolate--homocysteine methyltransferase|nr:methionine synthase [Bacteroidales bacterium]
MFDCNILKNRVLLLDGAMGTCISQLNLSDKYFNGKRLNDILNITHPKIIQKIHTDYLEAGADIIETNTMNSNKISLADYHSEEMCYQINYEGAKLAKQVAQKYSTEEKPRFVAGAIGITSKSLSLSPFECSFDELYDAFVPQINGLIDGGVDIFLVETVFDALNAKAALLAIEDICKERTFSIPIILSCTISDLSGRILSGQTIDSFYYTFADYDLLAIGLNCGLGPRQMLPHINILERISRFPICLYPNAGLPDGEGKYNQPPSEFAKETARYFRQGKVNIIGGCCGTTPEHIQELATRIDTFYPRMLEDYNIDPNEQVFTGLETCKCLHFLYIGERTNVAGSKKFARLIREKKYEQAVSVAKEQIQQGADAIDICMDDGLLNNVKEMEHFLKLISTEPAIAKVPVMIDSSEWDVIKVALKCIQGKPIVNSISLKDGEKIFIRKAKYIQKFGAAVVVMLFDEKGQAVQYQRKIEIAQRAYNLLISNGFPAKNIIFDPNILAIATGIEEHNTYALAYISACSWIKENLPHCLISGGVSNLSVAFRGNDYIRAVMHEVFLNRASGTKGMDMAIVNPIMLADQKQRASLKKELRNIMENLIFNIQTETALNDLLAYAATHQFEFAAKEEKNLSPSEKLQQSLYQGETENLSEIINNLLQIENSALAIVDNLLMPAMYEVGTRFGKGKMFLPQVLKSASVLSKSIALLKPYLEEETQLDASKKIDNQNIILATVKGDVHDIGKNMVSVILASNGYQIIDLGVMVEAQKIVNTALQKKAVLVGLSGLISPSLEEIKKVLQLAAEKGLKIPFLVGGATVSEAYTALHLADIYPWGVIYVKDASTCAQVVKELLENPTQYIENQYNKYKEIQVNFVESTQTDRPKRRIDFSKIKKPNFFGVKMETIDLEELVPAFMDWKMLLPLWGENYRMVEYDNFKAEAKKLLNQWITQKNIRPAYSVGLFSAHSEEKEIIVYHPQTNEEWIRLDTCRAKSERLLAHLIAPKDEGIEDYVGCFVATIKGIEKEKEKFDKKSDVYHSILAQCLGNCLAEGLSRYLFKRLKSEWWQFETKGIRPAVGYPVYPSHNEKEKIFKLLSAEKIGVSLTENYAMLPQASVCGLYLANIDTYNL